MGEFQITIYYLTINVIASYRLALYCFRYNANRRIKMAQGSSLKKTIGIVLMVSGVSLALWGLQMSGTFGSELSRAFTGSDTDEVLTFYILGAASLIIGFFLYSKK